MKISDVIEDNNILISYQNNRKELMMLKTKFDLLTDEIKMLKNENSKLKKQNENLKLTLTSYKSKEMNYDDINNKINRKNSELNSLNEELLSQKKQYCEELRIKDVLYEKEISEMNLKQEAMKFQIKNFEKMSQLNDIFYYRILELEKIIKDNKTEQQQKLQQIKMSYVIKLENYKKKTIEFLKKEKEKDRNLGTQETLNARLNSIHIQELTNELEIQSREIVDLITEKNQLQLQKLCLLNDVGIYHDILKAKTDRKNNIEKKLKTYFREKSSSNIPTNKSEKNSILDFYNNKFKNFSETKNHNKIFINENVLKNLKKFENNLATKRVVNNSKNTLTNSSDKVNTFLKINECKDLLREKEKYKDLYTYYKEKYELLINRYSDILNAYNEELEKLYNENKKIFSEENINIDINNFQNFQFQNMKPEEKYSILIKLINNIAPLVIKKDLDKINMFQKAFKVKEKYNLDKTRSLTFSNAKENSSLYSSIKKNNNSIYYNFTDNNDEIKKLNKMPFQRKKNNSVIKIDSKKQLYIKMQGNNSSNNNLPNC